MTPYWTSKGLTLLRGDCRDVLRGLPEKSVQCVVTSPPYWGLRSYEGVEPSVWGGDAGCEHEWGNAIPSRGRSGWDTFEKYRTDGGAGKRPIGEWDVTHGGYSHRCGAWRGHLGLEPTPELFVAHIVEVFREVWRVLRDDGTLWLNLGDSYAANRSYQVTDNKHKDVGNNGAMSVPPGLKPKDLVGIPWRVAFALQADGWYLRSDIIWSKPNPMPESVTDRPTKAHEYIFLLTKQPRYFYDAEAVREPNTPGSLQRYVPGERIPAHKKLGGSDRACASFLDGQVFQANGRNLRSVWTIPTQSFKAAHFATFPEKLVATCLKAGTSSKGCCPECGTAWRRVVEKPNLNEAPGRDKKYDKPAGVAGSLNSDGQAFQHWLNANPSRTVGWQPGCGCVLMQSCDEPLPPCTVLDLFIGSGTTLVVAKQLGLHGIGIDASKVYLEMARRRIENPRPESAKPDAKGQNVLEFSQGASDDGL